ncbi:hypothetical protein ACJ41O_013269 [Fusarium nematophilum]
MANNAAPQPFAFGGGAWIQRPTASGTMARVLHMTDRLSKLRVGNFDMSDASEYAEEAAGKAKVANHEVQLLNLELQETLSHHRGLVETAKAFARGKEAVAKVEGAKAGEEASPSEADADALLAWLAKQRPEFVTLMSSFGDELPPKLREQLASMCFEVPDSQSLDDSEEKVAELLSENADLAAEVEKLRHLKGEVNSLGEQKRRLEANNEAIKRDCHDLRESLAASEAKYGKWKQEMDRLTGSVATGERQRAALQQEKAKAEAERNRLKHELDKAHGSLKDVLEKGKSMKAQLAQCRESLQAKTSEYELAKEVQADLQAENSRLQAELAEAKSSLTEAREVSREEKRKVDRFEVSATELADECDHLAEAERFARRENDRIQIDLNAARLSLRKAEDMNQSQQKRLVILAGEKERLIDLLVKGREKADARERQISTITGQRKLAQMEIAQLEREGQSHKAAYKKQWSDFQGALEEQRTVLQAKESELSRLKESADPDVKWADPLIHRMIDGEGAALVERLPPRAPEWELLPAWASWSRPGVTNQDAHSMMLELVVLSGRGTWDEESGAYEALRRLKAVLLGPSGVVMQSWVGRFLFSVLSRAVTQETTGFIVRVATWQVLLMLDQRWPGISDKAFIERSDDKVGWALRGGRPDLTHLDSEGQRQIHGQLEMFCPPSRSGLLMVDYEASTMRWVAMDMIEVSLAGVTFTPPPGLGEESMLLRLERRALIWAYANLK